MSIFSRQGGQLELVKKAQAGDREAFVALVEAHQAMVSGVTLSILQDFAASEDAAQVTFVKAWRKLSSLKEPKKLKSWLAVLARNTALEHLRSKKRKKETGVFGEDYEEERLGPDQISEAKDDLEFVFGHLASLPEKYRTPLVLYYREEQSMAAVGEALGLSQDAVRQRLKRGRDELRSKVESSMARALARTAPTVAFTASVAGAVAALAPGSASAAAGISYSSVTASSGSASSSVVTGTVMNTSKISLTTVSALCLLVAPLGYGLGSLVFNGDNQLGAEVESNGPIKEFSRDEVEIPSSQVAIEWERLLAAHGREVESFSSIAKEIAEREKGLLRSSLEVLLAAEWVKVDGQSLYDFFAKGRSYNRGVSHDVFIEEWLKKNPERAVIAFQKEEYGMQQLSRRSPVLALSHPEVLLSHLEEFQFGNGTNSSDKRRALGILVEFDYAALRDAGLSLEGPAQRSVLGAALSYWAEREPQAAISWVRGNLPEGSETQMEILAQALQGIAQVNFEQAMESLDLTFEEIDFDKDNWSKTNLAGGLWAKYAQKDFEGACRWWGENRRVIEGKGHFNFQIRELLFERLAQEPESVLNALAENGLMDGVSSIFGTSSYNHDYLPQYKRIVETLAKQETSRGKMSLLQQITHSLSQTDPDAAYELLQNLKPKDQGQEYEQAYNAMLDNAVRQMIGAQPSLTTAKTLSVRYPSMEGKFMLTALCSIIDPEVTQRFLTRPELAPWKSFVAELDDHNAANVMHSFANAYVAQEPGRAFAWLASLPEERFESYASREDTMSLAFQEWATTSREEVWQWMEKSDLFSYPEELRVSFSVESVLQDSGLEQFWELFHSMPDEEWRENICHHLKHRKVSLESVLQELGEQDLSEGERVRYEELLRN